MLLETYRSIDLMIQIVRKMQLATPLFSYHMDDLQNLDPWIV